MRRASTAVVLAVLLGSRLVLGQVTSNTADVPAGMEAVTVRAYQTMPIGAILKPGDRVHILTSSTDHGWFRLILSNVLVLAVNKREEGASTSQSVPDSVVLAVNPADTELIAKADRAGTLQIRPGGVQIFSPQEAVTRMFDSGRWQRLALDYLKERYPNIEPSRFVCLSGSGGLMCVFGDEESAQDHPDEANRSPVTYRVQYTVRMNAAGELMSIQQEERDDGILKITPAPYDFPIRPLYPVPEAGRTNRNRIIVLPPEWVPQQP